MVGIRVTTNPTNESVSKRTQSFERTVVINLNTYILNQKCAALVYRSTMTRPAFHAVHKKCL